MKSMIGLCFISAVAIPLMAFASPEDGVWTCKKGSLVRKVEVKYTAPGKKVPCGVVYTKENQTEGKEIYHYANESGLCETKAKAFAEKLAGFGYHCE